MSIKTWSFVSLLSCVLSQAVAGSVVVTYYNSAGNVTGTATFSNTETVIVSLNTFVAKVQVVAQPTPAEGDIGHISVIGSTDHPTYLFVTTDHNQGVFPPSTYGARNLDGITDHTGYVFFKGRLAGDVTDSLDVQRVVYLLLLGEVKQWVRAYEGSMYIDAGSIAAGGDITLEEGPIQLVRTNTGNMLGDVKALAGSIGTIESLGSNSIGSASISPTIEASEASASGYHIATIRSFGHIWANIDCNTSTAGVDGIMNIFQCGNTNSPSTSGDFYGNIKIGSYAFEHMYVGRDLYGTIEIGSDLPAAATNGNPKRLLIGRSFIDGAQITLPDNGLHGYIKVSRMLPGQGEWEDGAIVTIGSTTLTGPNYTNSFSSLGGGAVSVAPFGLHNSACTPANGATELVAGSSISSVRLRHYGPLNPLTTTPVSISRRPLCSTGSYTTVTGATFNLDDDNPNATEPNCTLVVNLAFQVGYQYKITPSSSLQCWGADNVPVQWDSDYIINIRTACFADATQDGVINVQDLLAVINAWGTCSGCPADLVTHPCGDGLVNVQDLLAVINGWGLSCTTFEYGNAGSMESVQDCMDSCSVVYTPYTQDWNNCVNTCVDALCEAGKIPCD